MANALIALIKKKQARIARLDAQKAAVQAELDEASAMLSKKAPTDTGAAPPATPKTGRKAKKPRPGSSRVGTPGIIPTSSVGLAVGVLKRAGKPLPVTDIIRELQAQGHNVVKTTLVGNLSRYVKAKRVFFRAAPSIFGLLEFKKGA